MKGRVRAAGASGVLAAGLVAAAVQPSSEAAAVSGCVPRIIKLPLPAGYVGGDVLDIRGDVLVGDVSTENGDTRPAEWRRNSGGFRVRTLGPAPAAPFGFAGQISAAGDIVGTVATPHGEYGFVLSGGKTYRLRDFAGRKTGTYGRQVNQSGVAAGGANDSGTSFGALWRSWTSRPQKLLPSRGDVGSEALGLNNGNDAVGRSTEAGSVTSHGDLWPHGSSHPLVLPGFGTDIAAPFRINDRRRIVGSAVHLDGRTTAAVWDGVSAPRDLGVLRGDIGSDLLGVSAGGRAVGESHREIYLYYPVHVLYWPGHGPAKTLLPLSRHYGDNALAHAVDDRGNVGGFSDDGSGVGQPTLWTCADRQAFVPPAGKTSGTAARSTTHSVPQLPDLDLGRLPARMRSLLVSGDLR
jgi:hypothetical protein